MLKASTMTKRLRSMHPAVVALRCTFTDRYRIFDRAPGQAGNFAAMAVIAVQRANVMSDDDLRAEIRRQWMDGP